MKILPSSLIQIETMKEQIINLVMANAPKGAERKLVLFYLWRGEVLGQSVKKSINDCLEIMEFKVSMGQTDAQGDVPKEL